VPHVVPAPVVPNVVAAPIVSNVVAAPVVPDVVPAPVVPNVVAAPVVPPNAGAHPMQDALVCRNCQRGFVAMDEVARMVGTMICETCQGPLLVARMEG
jgi:hypothetical protein